MNLCRARSSIDDIRVENLDIEASELDFQMKIILQEDLVALACTRTEVSASKTSDKSNYYLNQRNDIKRGASDTSRGRYGV